MRRGRKGIDVDGIPQCNNDAGSGESKPEDGGAEFEGDRSFLFRVVPDDYLKSLRSTNRAVNVGTLADLVLRELGFLSTPNDSQVVSPPKHLSNSNTSIEIL